MASAFLRAIGQLDDPAIQRLIWKAVLIAGAVFALLWLGIARAVTEITRFEDGDLAWLEWAIDLMGFLAVPLLAWLLFPAVVNVVIGWLLDDVADAVEARYYPDLPAIEPPPFRYVLLSSLRLVGKMLVLNLVVLLFLLIPPVFPFVFYGVNGYLLGREYFELAALRRVQPIGAETLRKTHRWQILLAGIVTALALTVPIINLLAPVIVTAAMVHAVEAWRKAVH